MDREPETPYRGAPAPSGRVSTRTTGFTILLSIAFASFVVLAGCGRSSAAPDTPPPDNNTTTSTSSGEASTTSTAAAFFPPATQPPSTTLADVPPPVLPDDGTVVDTALPDGAVGPDTFVVDYDGKTLLEVIGVDSYRLHFEYEAASEDGEWEYGFAADIDVIEQAAPAKNWHHERWFEFDRVANTFTPHTEIVFKDWRYLVYDPSIDEWADIPSPLDIPPNLAVPWLYAPDGYSALYGVSFFLPRSEWLGNEEIDGEPVGHFRLSSFTEAELELIGQGLPVEASVEFWVDADGVVRRRRTTTSFEGSHSQVEDTTLADVGADFTIEAPTPSVPTAPAS